MYHSDSANALEFVIRNDLLLTNANDGRTKILVLLTGQLPPSVDLLTTQADLARDRGIIILPIGFTPALSESLLSAILEKIFPINIWE